MSKLPFPLENHVFLPSKSDDFLCACCQRPRALHFHDGFRPSSLPSIYDRMPTNIKFRGPHPRFSRPGATQRKDFESTGGVLNI